MAEIEKNNEFIEETTAPIDDVKAEEIPRVLNGLGIAIISTSKGLMTGKKAKEAGLGGEVLAYIW